MSLKTQRPVIFCGICYLLNFSSGGLAAAEEAISLSVSFEEEQFASISYDVSITGEISTPNPQGVQSFPLTSSGQFKFTQKQLAARDSGQSSLKAVRQFEVASTKTTVGKDHETAVALPLFYRTIHAYGSDDGLLQLCPRYNLPRKQVDLLQMPFDVLPAQALLTSSDVKIGDKWNAAGWVTPMLIGVEAVVKQSVVCRLQSYSDTEAIVGFEGAIDGAVQGSATRVTFNGTLIVDRIGHFIKSLSVTQNEKRSPGPVSPGLDVVAQIHWTQQVESTLSLPDTPVADSPSAKKLQLLLQTPLKLQLTHSREWHLFHETPSVLMMRQLRQGNLVSQCNISSAVTVPPGEHTADTEFRADVEASVKERKGRVTAEDTVRDDDRWRIRRVKAIGNAAGNTIQWDYFMCAAATGEQFSVVFSYSQEDAVLFGDEAMRLLSTLQIARKATALPFR